MNFTIIGAGNMGMGIATRLLSGGSSVVIRDRDLAEAQQLAQELRSQSRNGASISAEPMDAPIKGDAVVLAVYYPSVPALLKQYGSQLAGKIVVDISNPLNATFDDLGTPPGTSAAEETAKLLPAGAKLVKAFNTTFAGTLLTGQVAVQPVDVFIAGDDAEAKAQLTNAISAGGLRVIDAGPLRRARQLEGMGMLHIALQSTMGSNWGSTIKILS